MSDHFPDELDIRDHGLVRGVRRFLTLEPFRYVSPHYGTVWVPRWFDTDFGSIPKIAQSIVSPLLAIKEFTLHDFIYSPLNTQFTRFEGDYMLDESLALSGFGRITRESILRPVRLFGWRNFQGQPPANRP